jgi:beta-mannosidase
LKVEMSVKSKTLLDSEWRVRELPGEDVPEHNRLGWLPAQVPGHVHLDLMAAGVLSDLNYRMQERSAQWVDDLDWQYETSFKASPVVGAHTFLLFNGLDTIAEISLNGTLLGTADNMFSTHEFRVDNYLINENDGDGLNVLQVTFRSAKKTGILRQLEWNEGPDAITPHWDNWSHRAMIRKSQYMYGWDWGPVFISCGIWQPVELITVESGRLLDWKYAYELRDERALVTVSTVVERPDPTNTTKLRLVLQLNTDSIEIDVPDAAGRHELSGTLQIENAKLWQPAGLNPPGNQPALYTLRTVLADQAGNILDTRSSTIGLRTIELLHEGGSGAGFQFRINGQPIFVKGANWIPNNSFPAVTNTTGLSSVRERIRQAYDAGFNMLRVWGGGLYETEEFYNACDELGLMVWQDFAYGCSYYPDTGKYARDARIEAVSAVRRIRNHPSLALWCGNNENQTMFHWGSLSPHRLVGEGIFHEILPGVVAAESPGIPYWPSSPYGGDDPNSADYGDCHNWDVWHGRGDWVHYVENDSRFCSEFGFASSCGLPAWETILKPTDRSPRSPSCGTIRLEKATKRISITSNCTFRKSTLWKIWCTSANSTKRKL